MATKRTSTAGGNPPVVPAENSGLSSNKTSASIGRALRRLRSERNLTIRDLGTAAGLSAAMISRMENGQVSPSLTSLEALAAALNVPLIALFSDTAPSGDVTFVPSGGGLSSQRVGADHMHDFYLLCAQKSDTMIFDAARVRLDQNTKYEPARHFGQGHVLLHMLSGEMVYSCAKQTYDLAPGDTLSFGTMLDHGVDELRADVVEFLMVTARPT